MDFIHQKQDKPDLLRAHLLVIRRQWLVPLLLAFALSLGVSSIALAATITVNGNSTIIGNDGSCTLPEAIINANFNTNNNPGGSTDCTTGSGADTIRFSSDMTIVLTATLPTLSSLITVDGGSNQVVISGGGTLRVFNTTTTAITITNLTIENAKGNGAAIQANNNSVTIDSVTFINNTTSSNNGGGAIRHQVGGNLTIINSTFYSNSTSGATGGGAIYFAGTTANIAFSTFYKNSAEEGAIAVFRQAGTVTINNSIIHNSEGTATCSGTIGGGNNYVAASTNACGTRISNVTSLSLTPVIHGGSVKTLSLNPLSNAINTASSCVGVSKDARGVTRPQGANCDVGAYENSTPVATADSYNTLEDTPLTVAATGLLLNDTDEEGGALSAVLVANPDEGQGTLTLNSNGSFIFTPDSNFVGNASFSYKANDGNLDSNTVTVSISVAAVNDAPQANDDSYSVDEDSTLTIAAFSGLLQNDTDVENSALHVIAITTPATGTLTLNSDGSFIYTPTANFNGSESFTYKINDGTADSGVATVVITVNSVNDAPLANDATVSLNEDSALAITIVASDVDDDQLSYTAATPQHGTIDGIGVTKTYTPTADYNGGDSFVVEVCDDTAQTPICVEATITITVYPIADAPTATPQSVTTAEDTALAITLSGNDVDGDSLLYSILSNPSNGTLGGIAPSLIYTPSENYNGGDNFTFQVCDDADPQSCVSALITITVSAVNDTPIANPQSLSTPEDTNLAITLTGSDVETSTLTFVPSDPANGTVIGVSPNFTYTPDANYHGADSFTFTANDGALTSSPATVNIDVTALVDAPTANDLSITTSEDSAASITLSGGDVDGDTITFTVVTLPISGTLSGPLPNLSYTPSLNFHGNDSFTYRSNDGSLDSALATVQITVTAINDTPTADTQMVTVFEVARAITLTGSDVNLDPLTFSVVVSPDHGTLSGIAPNLSYSPTLNYTGTDSFTFQVCDPATACGQADVLLAVGFENDAPLAQALATTTDEDVAVAIGLLASDEDSTVLTYTVVSNPANGIVTINGLTVTYTSTANFNGADSFTYRVTDGFDDSNVATVSLTVNAVNDTPTANGQSVTTAEDTPRSITLTGSDVENSLLTYSVVGNPAHGTVAGIAANLIYTPVANYHGSDIFTFTVSDGSLTSVAAALEIAVSPVNDAPIATSQNVTSHEDSTVNITLGGSDGDGDLITFTVVTSPTQGSLSGSNGNLSYTPAANVHGSDSFTFKANDGNADSNQATLSITLTAVNDTPVVDDQNVTTNEDEAVAITFNASDVDGDTVTYTMTVAPQLGVVSGSGDSRIYTPAANESGSDSFVVAVCDDGNPSLCDSAMVTITIEAVNDAPSVADQNITSDEDTSITITLAASDVDGDVLSYTTLVAPQHGTISGEGDTKIYTPTANFNGNDSFTVEMCDQFSLCASATINITIDPINDTPQTAAQSAETTEDVAVNITLVASDGDHDLLAYSVIVSPTHGSLGGIQPNLVYTPSANFHGSDSFTFRVNDGLVDSNSSTINITINSINDAPVANDQNLTTEEDTPLAISLLGTDVDGNGLSYSVTSDPTHGNLSGSAPNLTYTPDSNYNGFDSITFNACDPTPVCDQGVVVLTVGVVNDAPLVQGGEQTTNEDTALSIQLIAHDADDDNLTYSILSDPGHGSLSGVMPDLAYLPDANYHGIDSFTFRVNDGLVDSNNATISITIRSINDAPIANDQTLTTEEDSTRPITLTGSDVDADALSYRLTVSPTHGSLSGSAPNLIYTPASNYHGADSITFNVCDPTPVCDQGVIALTVGVVNDDPLAQAGTFTTNEDTAVNVPLLASDADGDNLSYTIVTSPSHGSLSGVAPALIYTPTANYHGSDSFTFRVNDGKDDSNQATVNLTVKAVNDRPVANHSTLSFAEDNTVVITLTSSDVDGDGLSFVVVKPPTHGTLSNTVAVLASANSTVATLIYTPDANYYGADSFTFHSSDGQDNSPDVTVQTRIDSVNDAPTVMEQTLTTTKDTALAITLVGNDVEGSPLIYSIVSLPGHGTLSGVGANLTYSPELNYVGDDIFIFKAYDGRAYSNLAIIQIRVNPGVVDDSKRVFLPLVAR